MKSITLNASMYPKSSTLSQSLGAMTFVYLHAICGLPMLGGWLIELNFFVLCNSRYELNTNYNELKYSKIAKISNKYKMAFHHIYTECRNLIEMILA